ncbi:Putative ribonuclease H protein At1g65750 [Linum perenne]
MSPPTPDGGDDDLIWGPDPKGRFTIKSAYDIIATSRDPSPHNTWNFIWKWQGPSRIKHFLWLAAHDRLLSNAERHRRHMTVTDNCHRCTNVSETSLHILRRRRETLLRWIPAPDEWLTVNCDGSVIQPGSLAAAGGIIRNSSVRKLGVFAANLGTCTITRAELRAASISLDMAWNMGARKVHLQVDSLVAVRAITGLCSDDSRHSHDIHQIQRMLERNWSVEVHHIYREKNRVADLLAHFGHSLNFGAHFDFTCNSDIERAISADCIGVCFPRLINFNE